MPHAADVSPASFELAKWVAIVTMAVDHVGKIVAPDWFGPTHLIGRLAFPLFVWIIASRLAIRPAAAGGYIRWLLPWAIVSQPVFVIAGRDWYDGNIFFTLLAGVLIVRALQAYGHSWTSWLIAGALAAAGLLLDYGPAGVLAIPVLAAAARIGVRESLLVLGVVGIAVNLPALEPFYVAAAFASLAAVGIAALSLRLEGAGLPRLPRAFFYAFYPGHLLLLALVAHLLPAN